MTTSAISSFTTIKAAAHRDAFDGFTQVTLTGTNYYSAAGQRLAQMEMSYGVMRREIQLLSMQSMKIPKQENRNIYYGQTTYFVEILSKN